MRHACISSIRLPTSSFILAARGGSVFCFEDLVTFSDLQDRLGADGVILRLSTPSLIAVKAGDGIFDRLDEELNGDKEVSSRGESGGELYAHSSLRRGSCTYSDPIEGARMYCRPCLSATLAIWANEGSRVEWALESCVEKPAEET